MAATGVFAEWRNDAAGQEAAGAWLRGLDRPVHWSVTGQLLVLTGQLLVSSSTPEASHDPQPSVYKRNEPRSSFTPLFLHGIYDVT